MKIMKKRRLERVCVLSFRSCSFEPNSTKATSSQVSYIDFGARASAQDDNFRLANDFSVICGHFQELSDSHLTLVAFLSLVDSDNAFSLFLFAYNNLVRNLLQFALADLVAEFLIRLINFHADAGVHEFLLDLLRVVNELLGNREHAGLHRSEPQREIAHELGFAPDDASRSWSNKFDRDSRLVICLR